MGGAIWRCIRIKGCRTTGAGPVRAAREGILLKCLELPRQEAWPASCCRRGRGCRRGAGGGGRAGRAGRERDGQQEAGHGEEGAGRACVHGNSDSGLENRRPLASGTKQGSGGGSHESPDLSLEGSSGDGRSATGLPPQGAVTVAGLCRNHTGFATRPRRFCRNPKVPLTLAA